jgi:hypothetical protein
LFLFLLLFLLLVLWFLGDFLTLHPLSIPPSSIYLFVFFHFVVPFVLPPTFASPAFFVFLAHVSCLQQRSNVCGWVASWKQFKPFIPASTNKKSSLYNICTTSTYTLSKQRSR